VLLADVNVLVYAHREDARDHEAYEEWLSGVVNGDHAYAMSSTVVSGFLRVVTHPRVFAKPTPMREAVAFAQQLRDPPQCVIVEPGERHWAIFSRLCLEHDARGNLVPDAYLAALAIETGCELVTTDRDFTRFTGLRTRHPLG
jgi:toxin-antitoxin system PIN domain toxin